MRHTIYSAIGNETRAKLLLCLSDRAKNVTELIRTCGLSQSAVSQHLIKLKQAGLVQADKDGTTVWYSLRYKQAGVISKLLKQLKEEMI